MKKLMLFLAIIGMMSACAKEECATCTSPYGYTDTYCARKGSVDTYVDGLRQQGWSCSY